MQPVIPKPDAQVPQLHSIVVLIHGIRTHASWAEMVAAVVEPACGVKVIPVRYGYFDVFRFLCPVFTRTAPVARIVRELRDVRANYPTADISVIAHSFGTYAIVKALAEREVRLHRLILCGCIVTENFRRADYGAQLGPDDIVNDCGTHDVWPVLARSVTWGYGATGTFGFGTTGVRDRFNKFSHGDYFTKEFVERYWVPFLRTGEVLPTEWERERNTPPFWQSLLSWLPLKYLFLALLIAGGFASWKYAESLQRVKLDTGPEISIGHYMGVPMLIAPLKIQNGTKREVVVQSVQTTVTSPKGREIAMHLEGTIVAGQVMPPLLMLTAKANESVAFTYSYFNYTADFVMLRDEAFAAAQKTGIQTPGPNESLEYLTPEMTTRLTSYATRQFIWEPGEWRLKIRANRDDEPLSVERSFQLEKADVERMWNITKQYKSGIGVLPMWRLYSTTEYQPLVMKRLDIHK